jgi:predicted nucleic acid-binding protein
MPRLIVDSSVAVKWFVIEPYSTEALRILDQYRNGIISFLAPDLINAEFGNIIWKKHVLQGMAGSDAQNIMDDFRALPLTIVPTATLLDDAYKLAVKHQRTVYDSLYLALSLVEGCQFVTADEKFVNAVGSSFPSIISLANWS